MSIYTTPLQFGYFLALLMAILFWIRGRSHERLSDTLLGSIMFLLAMEIQDYTFGFAGINILWNEMNGFPRGTTLLLGPAVYFYLRSQLNRGFVLKRTHLLHLLPWFIPFIIELGIFLCGPNAVQQWQSSSFYSLTNIPRMLLVWGSYIFYFGKSIGLYRSYRDWAMNQYSDQELVSFDWYRNLVYFMIVGFMFKESMGLVDSYFGLDFYEDWWWNLAMVAIIFYVGIWGYAQLQPHHISYQGDEQSSAALSLPKFQDSLEHWRETISNHMDEHKPYLEPQLNLRSLSQQLKTNPSVLSSAINQNFNKNFNDFVNEYRIDEFIKNSKNPDYAHYTMLALALEAGFNSKSTFNRAFRKIKGTTPKEVLR